MSYQVFKIYNKDNFQTIVKGIKLAQCMIGENNISCPDIKYTNLQDLTVSDTLTCSFCNIAFDDQTQQRQHYKLDWHRYNLKQKLAGYPSVTEEYFIQITDQDDASSISGSDSDSDDESENDQYKNLTVVKLEPIKSTYTTVPSRHSKVFFENENGEIFSIYKCLLFSKKEAPDNSEVLVDLTWNINPNYCKWAIIMLGGGHFAAAVFDGSEAVVHKTFHSYTVRAKQGGSQGARDGRSAGSHPKSAGANLRRYNEASFTQHVQSILENWSSHLEKCSLIIYRAVGPHNRTVLFGGKSPALNKLDRRLRTIPFATRRATFNEVKRVHEILSSVEIYGKADLFSTDFPVTPNKKDSVKNDIDKESSNKSSDDGSKSPTKGGRRSRTNSRGVIINRAKSRELVQRPLPGQLVDSVFKSSSESEDDTLAFQDVEFSFKDCLQQFDNTHVSPKKNNPERNNENHQKKIKKPKPKKPKQKINIALENFQKKIWSVFDNGNSELMENIFIENNNDKIPDGVNENEKNNYFVTNNDLIEFLNKKIDNDGNTILHLAAIRGYDCIIPVLMKFGSDPCNKNKKNQTPYAASSDKTVRLCFRQFLTDFPEKYNYNKSQIPGPINKEEELRLAEKKREQKKIKKQKEKEKKKEKEAELLEQREQDRFAKLSDREKRALAAERRIINQNTGAVLKRCFLCGADITGKVPFEYSDNVFCTITCLKAHRISKLSIT